ncbi:MAG TPA: hypothetical protein VG960_07285 [Caulobacteraceae bacterium]|nr:hypothetical protein [Caulobacteraceae bacterium]
MNFCLSWIAIKGPSKASVLQVLGLTEVAADVQPLQSKYEVAELPSGWTVILAADFNYPSPARMAAVSLGGKALACSINERTMYSVARFYEDGKAVWSVDHDGGEKGVYHLDVAGDPPSELTEVRARLTARQDEKGGEDSDTDYLIELSGELSQVLCGYHFDPQEAAPPFTPLQKVGGRGGGWLRKLFGSQ